MPTRPARASWARYLPLLVHQVVQASPLVYTAAKNKAPDVPPGSGQFWWMLCVIVVLVVLGGTFAGLTLGELDAEPVGRSRGLIDLLATGLMGLDMVCCPAVQTRNKC
jgi:hypothetical protein